MSLRLLLYALALSVLSVHAAPARASSITYSYVGAPYGAPIANQTRDRLTGFITVDAPLSPGSHQITNPINFYFFDSINNYTPANVSVFPFLVLDIGASGAVENWTLNVLGPDVFNQISNSFISDPSGDVVFNGAARPDVSTVSGRWTESALVPTPEPSTLSLTGLGLLVIVGSARRRYTLR